MRLHTISLCPLRFRELLWATFLFSRKHIVQLSSVNMQKHLAQAGAGRLPVGDITVSSISISL